MKTLVLDGHNLMHRARSGFQLGEHHVAFNLFRSLRSLVERFEPRRVVFTLEGHPQHRIDLLPTYKANRRTVVEECTDPAKRQKAEAKARSDETFARERAEIVAALRHLPITVMRHPMHEADDLVYNLVRNSSSAVTFTVVSTDSDFVQLLQEFSNVSLFNPVTKRLVEAPEHDYVLWKALRGDPSDNVPGVPGIGDVRAAELASDPDALQRFIAARPDVRELLDRNVRLIRFVHWSDDEAMDVESSVPGHDLDALRSSFVEWGFESMLREPYWARFVATFDALVSA